MYIYIYMYLYLYVNVYIYTYPACVDIDTCSKPSCTRTSSGEQEGGRDPCPDREPIEICISSLQLEMLGAAVAVAIQTHIST